MDRNELVEREFLAQPVRSLQYMLRRLSEAYPILPAVVPDGIFGERTLEAVMLFQREFFPPVTGVVDSAVWNAIRSKWEEAERSLAAPQGVRAFPSGPAQPGERRETMVLPQTMFRLLARHFDGVVPDRADGEQTPDTEENIRWLQRSAGLEETGVMDSRTWNALTRLYEVFITGGEAAGAPRIKGGWG